MEIAISLVQDKHVESSKRSLQRHHVPIAKFYPLPYRHASMQAPKDGIAIKSKVVSALNSRTLGIHKASPSGQDIFCIIADIQMLK